MMIRSPKVCLDTNIIKFAATRLFRLFPHNQVIDWGHTQSEITIHEPRYVNPNHNLPPNARVRAEAELLQDLAERSKRGEFTAVMGWESLFESWRLPNLDSFSGKFYDAPVNAIQSPLLYARDLGGSSESFRADQVAWMRRIKNRRFIEIQKAAGAYKGNSKGADDQLLDAFHLWTAEHNNCDFFLTLDLKLIDHLAQDRKQRVKIPVVCPSALLMILKRNAQRRWFKRAVTLNGWLSFPN
jgi:hypothetical protein